MSRGKKELFARYPGRALAPFVATGLYVPAVAGAALPIAWAALRSPFSPERLAATLAASPLTFGLVFVSACALLSLPFRSAAAPGKYPRFLAHPGYGRIWLYGLCWGAFYTLVPVYRVVVTLRPLRNLVFRLFGYHGSSDVRIAADAWVRDLPLIHSARGAAIENASTVGSYAVLSERAVWLDRTVLGERSRVGTRAIVAPGAHVEAGASVGDGAALGLRAEIGRDAQLGAGTAVGHGATIGSHARVGALCTLGAASSLGESLTLPSGTHVPAGATLSSQADVDTLVARETRELRAEQKRVASLYASRSINGAARGAGLGNPGSPFRFRSAL